MLNFDQPFFLDSSIIDLLKQKIEIEKRLEIHFRDNGFRHFSAKKFVGDLGEYYSLINLKHLFEKETLKISETSNSECDIRGNLKNEVANEWKIDQDVRIEVKTRFHQKGKPHLFGVHKEKFDLLVFVSLNDNYSLHYIGVIKKNDLPEVDRQNRIVFHENLKIIYPNNIKFDQHK